MKLHYSPESQYVRKVMATAIENGLVDKIELIKDKKDLEKHNPLLKRPALITDDGHCIIDSPVICEYLDTLGDGKLIPPIGPARWKALTQEALADGVMEAATAIRQEAAFHKDVSSEWQERQLLKVNQGFDFFESQAASGALDGAVTIGHLTIGIMCGFIDYRLSNLNWRDGRPALAAWYEKFSKRPSMATTVPKAHA
jgi:glutathione S-transferase